MSENSTAPRKYAYNNNRLFIEEITDSPTNQLSNLNTNRQMLPAIRDATPINQQNSLMARNNSNNLSASLDLNNTQQKMKQLESRIQVTEVSNRALLEELIRLQNELAISLRRSFDTIAEERNARQILENNYKFQNDNFLQLIGRLKRAEDFLQEDRTAMQSLINYTRNVEQSNMNTIKELSVRRDFQAQRLEELRIQIDDLQRSKDTLERSAFTLLDEIKNLKSKVDLEALALNSINGDLSNKTRRLEDENRLQKMEFMRKQQDSMAITENNLFSVKTQLETKINEIRDMTYDLRNKTENDKEERRKYDLQLGLRFTEITSQINEEKIRLNEILRQLESNKRDLYQNMENERLRINGLLVETKESTSLIMNDKIDKAKDDLLTRIKDLERLISDESESRVKIQEAFKDSVELRIDNIKSIFEQDLKNQRDETKENNTKNIESIKKLNEGLNLIEKQNDERGRKLQQVISAEIKSRKQTEKNLEDKYDNYYQDMKYAMHSLQSNVGEMNNKIIQIKESCVSRNEFETSERMQERLKAELEQMESKINMNKDSIKYITNTQENQATRLKDINDQLYDVNKVQIPAINKRLSELITKEDFNNFNNRYDEKMDDRFNTINRDLDKINSSLKLEIDDKTKKTTTIVDELRARYDKKFKDNEKVVKDQIALQNENQLRVTSMLEQIDKRLETIDIDMDQFNSDFKEEKQNKNIQLNEFNDRLNEINKISLPRIHKHLKELVANDLKKFKMKNREQYEQLNHNIKTVEEYVKNFDTRLEKEIFDTNDKIKSSKEIIDKNTLKLEDMNKLLTKFITKDDLKFSNDEINKKYLQQINRLDKIENDVEKTFNGQIREIDNIKINMMTKIEDIRSRCDEKFKNLKEETNSLKRQVEKTQEDLENKNIEQMKAKILKCEDEIKDITHNLNDQRNGNNRNSKIENDIKDMELEIGQIKNEIELLKHNNDNHAVKPDLKRNDNPDTDDNLLD